MKKNLLLKMLLVLLCSSSIAACSSINIKETSFLRDQQQAVLYYLTRFGPSTSEDIAENTFYPVKSIEKRLRKLQEKQFVELQSDEWVISDKYREDEYEYVEAIENFEEETIKASLKDHVYSTRIIKPEGFQVASFVSKSATHTLIVFPGNGFNLVPDAQELQKLLAPQRNVFVMEYPGMGDSKGVLTIKSLKESAHKFFQTVVQEPGVNRTEIAVYGFSLGGFVATEIAASFDVDALILDSTAPDMQSWIDANVPLYAKAFVKVEADDALKQVNNTALIKNLPYPMLFIAGSEDEITPPDLVREIYDSAESSSYKNFVLLDGVTHGESLDHANFQPSIKAFMSRLTK